MSLCRLQILLRVALRDTPKDVYLMLLGHLYDHKNRSMAHNVAVCHMMKLGTFVATATISDVA